MLYIALLHRRLPMQTDEIPFLVQRIIHIENGTSIDVGVVHALDAEHARERAVANGLIEPLQAFRVFGLNMWDEPIPEHFRATAGTPEDNGSVMEAADRLVAAADELEDLMRAEDDGMIAA
jgi:hypothetical protein